jgi:hypothetical protein
MEAAYCGFYLSSNALDDTLLFVLVNAVICCMLGYAIFVKGVLNPEEDQLADTRLRMAVIVGFGILFRITLVWHPPVASQDILRYVWDGKVALAGFNPYAFAPEDPRLAALHTDKLPSGISFPEMRTIYPPLAQAFFFASNMIFGDSVIGMKVLFLCADIVGLLLVLRMLPLLNIPRRAVILAAWSPVLSMYGALDGHIDTLGVALFLAFLYLALKGRSSASAVVLGLSALTKLYPLFCAPFLAGKKPVMKELASIAVPILLVAAGYALYYEPTGGVFESLIAYNTTFAFNGPAYSVLAALAGSGAAARTACAAAFGIWLLWVLLSDRVLPARFLLAFIGFIVFSPTVHPWYLMWLAALLPMFWSPAVFLLLCTSNLSNIVVYRYHATGIWKDQQWLLALEYLPFVALFFHELLVGKWNRRDLRPA